jgi:hypothetical protein
MNRKIVFYTFVPFDESKLNRAYNIRIHFLKRAFEKLGYYIYFIDGFYEERVNKIKNLWSLIEKNEKIDFVYGELPNLPFLLTSKYRIPRLLNNYDIKFLRFLKEKKLRIGFFVRDLYHLTNAIDKLGIIKKILYIYFFNLSLLFLKKVIDIFFVPTYNFKELFSHFYKISITKISELPPGLSLDISNIYQQKVKKEDNNVLNLIYVGGAYNTLELFKCFQELFHSNIKNIFLYFITRKEEFFRSNYYLKEVLENELIKIIEANKNDLPFYYSKSDASLLFYKTFEIKNIYNYDSYDYSSKDYMALAFPVKFMEYLENLKPVITYKEAFVAKIIEENNIGWVIDYHHSKLKELLIYLLNNKWEIENKQRNIFKIIDKYSWDNVAKKVIDILI